MLAIGHFGEPAGDRLLAFAERALALIEFAFAGGQLAFDFLQVERLTVQFLARRIDGHVQRRKRRLEPGQTAAQQGLQTVGLSRRRGRRRCPFGGRRRLDLFAQRISPPLAVPTHLEIADADLQVVAVVKPGELDLIVVEPRSSSASEIADGRVPVQMKHQGVDQRRIGIVERDVAGGAAADQRDDLIQLVLLLIALKRHGLIDRERIAVARGGITFDGNLNLALARLQRIAVAQA